MTRPNSSEIGSKSSNCQTPSLIWVVDQDQLNPYVAYEGYVVRVPHNPLRFNSGGFKKLSSDSCELYCCIQTERCIH